MTLTFDTNVLEHGYTIGRLTGIEADRRTLVVRNIVIDGDTQSEGAQPERRPLVAVPADHFDGDIHLRGFSTAGESFAPAGVLTLTQATRVMRGGRQIGRLTGVEILADSGEIVSIAGRQHWWTRRWQFGARGLDFSVPGEIRVGGATSRAA